MTSHRARHYAYRAWVWPENALKVALQGVPAMGVEREDDKIDWNDLTRRLEDDIFHARHSVGLSTTHGLGYGGRKASPGLFVTYHLAQDTGSNGIDEAPAVIDHVWNDQCVDLIIFPDFANPFRLKSVYYNPNRRAEFSRSWSWPV